MSIKTPTKSKVALYAYTAEDRGDKTYWNRIGVAFLTKNGKGIHVSSSYLPVGGSLT